MNWPHTKRDIEKPPKTRTERHTRLATTTIGMIGQLKGRIDAARTLRLDHVPLSLDEVERVLNHLLALSKELKPDTRDKVA